MTAFIYTANGPQDYSWSATDGGTIVVDEYLDFWNRCRATVTFTTPGNHTVTVTAKGVSKDYGGLMTARATMNVEDFSGDKIAGCYMVKGNPQPVKLTLKLEPTELANPYFISQSGGCAGLVEWMDDIYHAPLEVYYDESCTEPVYDGWAVASLADLTGGSGVSVWLRPGSETGDNGVWFCLEQRGQSKCQDGMNVHVVGITTKVDSELPGTQWDRNIPLNASGSGAFASQQAKVWYEYPEGTDTDSVLPGHPTMTLVSTTPDKADFDGEVSTHITYGETKLLKGYIAGDYRVEMRTEGESSSTSPAVGTVFYFYPTVVPATDAWDYAIHPANGSGQTGSNNDDQIFAMSHDQYVPDATTNANFAASECGIRRQQGEDKKRTLRLLTCPANAYAGRACATVTLSLSACYYASVYGCGSGSSVSISMSVPLIGFGVGLSVPGSTHGSAGIGVGLKAGDMADSRPSWKTQKTTGFYTPGPHTEDGVETAIEIVKSGLVWEHVGSEETVADVYSSCSTGVTVDGTAMTIDGGGWWIPASAKASTKCWVQVLLRDQNQNTTKVSPME